MFAPLSSVYSVRQLSSFIRPFVLLVTLKQHFDRTDWRHLLLPPAPRPLLLPRRTDAAAFPLRLRLSIGPLPFPPNILRERSGAVAALARGSAVAAAEAAAAPSLLPSAAADVDSLSNR